MNKSKIRIFLDTEDIGIVVRRCPLYASKTYMLDTYVTANFNIIIYK